MGGESRICRRFSEAAEGLDLISEDKFYRVTALSLWEALTLLQYFVAKYSILSVPYGNFP